jgi:hypothetical protein
MICNTEMAANVESGPGEGGVHPRSQLVRSASSGWVIACQVSGAFGRCQRSGRWVRKPDPSDGVAPPSMRPAEPPAPTTALGSPDITSLATRALVLRVIGRTPRCSIAKRVARAWPHRDALGPHERSDSARLTDAPALGNLMSE